MSNNPSAIGSSSSAASLTTSVAAGSSSALPSTIVNNAGNTIYCGDLFTSFFNQHHHQQNLKVGSSTKQQLQYIQQMIQEDVDDYQNPNSKAFKRLLYQMVVK